MAITSDLAVRIGADISGLTKGLGEASKGLDGLGAKARAGAGSFATIGAAATAAGAAMVAGLVAKGMQAIDAQADLAAQLKTTSASIAVLNRAADLSGASMAQVETAGKRLAVVMGQADQGNKAAKETFDRLGLSARDLQAIPLDDRIGAINKAMAENIPVTQQAAVAAQLFGKEAGLAISQISGDALAQARKEAELFGLAISEADAAKVQQAADEFGKVGMAVDGVIQQLTVNLAPAITAVMRMFTETAEEAGGVGTAVASASNTGIKALGFLLDVIEGVRRAFSLAADAAIVAFAWVTKQVFLVGEAVINGPIMAINALIAVMNKLPGIDIEPVALTSLGETIREQITLADGIITEATAHMRETLERPMPSGVFAQYVEEAKLAAEEAAKVSTALTGGGGGGETDEEKKLREARERALAAESQYIADRLEAVREGNLSELQILEDKQAQEIEAINAGWEQKLLTDESWNVLMAETKARHEDEMTALEQKAADARAKIAEAEAANKQRIMASALSGLTTLMNSENRKMFEIGKAAAIAQSIISTYTGMTKALELGWPMGPIAAAAIGAAGFANVASIRSQSFGGGGSTATGSNTTAVNAASTPTASSGDAPAGGTLTVQGLSASSLFTGDAVAGLAEQLLDYQRRGGSVVLAG